MNSSELARIIGDGRGTGILVETAFCLTRPKSTDRSRLAFSRFGSVFCGFPPIKRIRDNPNLMFVTYRGLSRMAYQLRLLVYMRRCLTALVNPAKVPWVGDFGRRLKEQIATEVPADLALCEFDCNKSQCSWNEWGSCERRISMAAGELMPSAIQKAYSTNVRALQVAVG